MSGALLCVQCYQGNLDLYHSNVTWPSMVTHTRNVCSVFNTHLEQWAAIYAAAPREQLGVRCLAKGHLSCGIKAETAGHSLPPLTIPAGTETRTIRPRLPTAPGSTTHSASVWQRIHLHIYAATNSVSLWDYGINKFNCI